jgi:mannose-6-phosphate isomerase
MGRPVDHPLLLEPHLQERVWAGRSLGAGIGEAWDLSVHRNGPCRVANGPHRGRTLAEVAAERPQDFGGPIRLLAKRLDCGEDLSVQVHPKAGDPKTEAWVVLGARPGAGVYFGFRRDVTADEVRAAAADGSLPRLLRFVETRTGQSVLVRSGTVHAIGGGLFLFEIQQSADTTYRLYDWGRPREMHLEAGLSCADLRPAAPTPTPRPQADGSLRLVECEHFRVDRVDTGKPHRIDPGRTWKGVLLVAGAAAVGDLALRPGRTLVLPAAAGPRHLEPRGACTALVYGP